jgi:membrane-bound lytic murein transglycosylase A
MNRLFLSFVLSFLVAGCTTQPVATCPPAPVVTCPQCSACPQCPVCPPPEVLKPAEKPLQAATWADLPGWGDDDPQPAFEAFRASCSVLQNRALWRDACASAKALQPGEAVAVRAWFEARFRPWALVNPDGGRQGLITGYYEPILRASRTRKGPFVHPLFGPPDDLVVVDLADLYPELKHMRLRGRIEGRRLVPYYSRGEWADEEIRRAAQALLWGDDAIDLFFMEIQGSGQIQFDDGTRIRVSYSDQNGHPYRSIGRWLVDQGELKVEQASLQGIKVWAKAHPKRLHELLGANPSLVFFRELPLEGIGPPGALGVPLTPERSIAVDPRQVTLGAPVFLATTRPNDTQPLNRLMLAQDTGGAIRGVVRADFFWGSGVEAGSQAGRMRQKGSMWVLMPREYSPN